MTSIPILEVTIGLVFVYLLLSLVGSVLQEMIASLFKMRAENLWQGIENLLGNETRDGATKSLPREVYDHALIRGLAKEGKKPSYIPAKTFALALMNVIRPDSQGASAFDAAQTSVEKLPEGKLKAALTALVDDAESDVKRVRENIENWFDDAMDRAGGWYKRKAQRNLFLIGIVVAVGLNVDSIRVAEGLWQDPKLRAVVAGEAGQFIADNPDARLDKQLEELQQALGKLQLPIGWKGGFERKFYPEDDKFWGQSWNWIAALAGWTLTALAISLGASFWFNTLSKLLKLRAAGAAPERRPKPEA